ncbi:hypothetical protein JCM1841_003882 [Sporobolomyces salmonicolor]
MDCLIHPFSLVQALVPNSLDRLVSLNLVVSLAAAPLAGLIAFVLLLLLTRPRTSSKRPLSQTQRNTLLNRRENGGTGVWSRKWRRNVALALAIRPRRVEDDEELDDEGDGEKAAWRLVVKSPPEGLRSCLKRQGSSEAVTDAGVVEAPPSPISSSASSSNEAQPFPSPSPSPSPSPPPLLTKPAKPKSVRLLEPSLADLVALRELWSSPAMQGQGGAGGIAGYRRTRDFYVRGQGGRAVVKRPGAVVVESKDNGPAGGKKVDDKEGTTEEEEEDDETPSRCLSSSSTRRPLRLSALSAPSAAPPSLPAPSSTARSSSLSPSPLSRRALSPSSPASSAARSPSPAFLVGAHSKTRRRALSPSGLSSSSAASRTSSLSPVPGAGSTDAGSGRGVPRWVRTKAGRGVSPAPRRVETTASDEDEEDVDEEEAAEEKERGETLDNPVTATTTRSDPSSPLSGAESPDVSPTPSTNHPSHLSLSHLLPTHSLMPSPTPSTSRPETPQLLLTPSSPDLTRSSLLSNPLDAHGAGDASEPSPCVVAKLGRERRLGVRVQQALKA